MFLLDCFNDLCKKRANDIFISDGINIENYSFDYVDKSSSRIYNYLVSNNYKADDIIAIRLKRSVKIPISIIGILKAGVAFVVIGERSPKETVSKILGEVKPKLIIDENVYNEMLSSPTKSGYKEPSLRDLATIIYSSGSSCIFKGCMHEYGALDRKVKLIKKYLVLDVYETEESRISLTAGFYTVSAVWELFFGMITGEYIDIVPYEITEDSEKYNEQIIKNKITEVFLAPHKIKNFDFTNFKDIKYVNTAFEIFSNLYIEKPTLTNCYGLSETLGLVSFFEVDKPYEITPSGYILDPSTVKIIGQDGNEVNDGEMGEICIFLKYFRGYINNPELTKQKLIDGWLHTGDMGKFLQDKNLVVYGRSIDFFKTEKGYIVPSEIALKAVNALGLSWAYVKVFDEKTICFYYCDDIDITVTKMRNALKKVLPEYSLPTHCIKINRIPCYLSGKIDRNAFPNPKEQK